MLSSYQKSHGQLKISTRKQFNYLTRQNFKPHSNRPLTSLPNSNQTKQIKTFRSTKRIQQSNHLTEPKTLKKHPQPPKPDDHQPPNEKQRNQTRTYTLELSIIPK